MKQRVIAIVVSLALFTTGCASAGATNSAVTTNPRVTISNSVMASYVSRLAVGSRVRLTLADGRVIRGTLMKTDDPVVVQKRTRIPEAPLEIPIANIRAVELEKNGSGPGRAIAIGAAAGAGAAVGVLLILAAIFAD